MHVSGPDWDAPGNEGAAQGHADQRALAGGCAGLHLGREHGVPLACLAAGAVFGCRPHAGLPGAAGHGVVVWLHQSGLRFGQVGPNLMPVIGSQVAARHGALRGRFDG